MNFRTTVILGIVVIAGGLCIALYERELPSAQEAAEQAKRVFNVEGLAKSVTKLEIQREGETLMLKKVGEGDEAKWRLTAKPKLADVRADESEVKSLLRRIEFLEKKNYLAKADLGAEYDLKKWGLDPSEVKTQVAFWDESGEHRLHVGDKTSNGVYVRVVGRDEVYLVSEDILGDTEKELNRFRSKKALALDVDKICSMEITCSGDKVALGRREAYDDWQLTTPPGVPTNDWECDRLLNAIKDLEIKEWTEEKTDDVAKYGLDAPQLRITLTQREEGGETPQAEKSARLTHTLLIGKKVEGKEDRHYAKNAAESPILEVDAKEITEVATRGYLAFRDRSVFDFSKDDVEKVTIEREGKSWVCERDAKDRDKWNFASPSSGEADGDVVDGILSKLYRLEAKKFVAAEVSDLDQYGLASPEITVTVDVVTKEPGENEDEKEAVSHRYALHVSDGRDGKRYATAQGSEKIKEAGLVFEISPGVGEALAKDRSQEDTKKE